MQEYSFIYHPVKGILDNLKVNNPGIKDAYAIYCDYSKKLKYISYSCPNSKEITIGNKAGILQKFRNIAIHKSWINRSSLPIIHKKSKKLNQLSLNDEDKNSFLLLKFTSPVDHSSDIILFNIASVNAFGMTSSKDITSNQKMLIGNILAMSIDANLRTSYNNYYTLQIINESYNYQIDKVNRLNEQINSISDNASKSISLFVDSFAIKMEKEINKKIIFDNEIINEIIESNQKIEVIEEVLKKAVNISINTSLSNNSDLKISSNHIMWPIKSLPINAEKKIIKHYNVLEFLDRYEKAITIAIDNNWKAVGSTVGNLCKPKVSAASISFNFKKYSSPIKKLVIEYNDRWPLLVAHFRPLQNILNSHKLDDEALSA